MLPGTTSFDPHTALHGVRLPVFEIGEGQLREDKGLLEITQLRDQASWDFTASPAIGH